LTGKRPWTLVPKVHIALPSATQNEVSKEEAEALVKAGVRIVAEGSNMVITSTVCRCYFNFLTVHQGCTKEAIDVFEESRKKDGQVWYAPGSKSVLASFQDYPF